MGTATFTLAKAGYKNQNVRGRLVDSGAHTTSTTASNLTNGAAGGGSAVSAKYGDIITLRGDEDMRVNFGGEAATAAIGQIVFANETTDLEVSADGAISIIDVA